MSLINSKSLYRQRISTQNGRLDSFRGKRFCCSDEKPGCCFNHIVGLPEKDGQSLPLFDYEVKLFRAWKEHKHLWILKATGLGVTEFFLRLMLWLAVRNDDYKGCQFCLVVGPNIDLAKKLIKRMRNILRDNGGQQSETQTSLEVNNVWIQAFPSNHLDAYRSLDKPKFIFLDEADFFRRGEQEDVRHVSERYIAKSDPYLVMVSTPNRPDGLMHEIEKESPSLYHKIRLGYEEGIGKIYSAEDIEKAKQSPSFEREYNLKYLGKIGNVFSPQMIDDAVALGQKYKNIEPNQNNLFFGGIDPGFSKFTPMYVGEVDKERQCIRIVRCERFDNTATPEQITKVAFEFRNEYGGDLRWFVDASNRALINTMKLAFNESQSWQKAEEVSPQTHLIVPVNFGSNNHKYMLEHLHLLLSKRMIAIPAEYTELITALKTAQANEWDLNKDETVFDDDLDCLRLLVNEAKIE